MSLNWRCILCFSMWCFVLKNALAFRHASPNACHRQALLILPVTFNKWPSPCDLMNGKVSFVKCQNPHLFKSVSTKELMVTSKNERYSSGKSTVFTGGGHLMNCYGSFCVSVLKCSCGSLPLSCQIVLETPAMFIRPPRVV